MLATTGHTCGSTQHLVCASQGNSDDDHTFFFNRHTSDFKNYHQIMPSIYKIPSFRELIQLTCEFRLSRVKCPGGESIVGTTRGLDVTMGRIYLFPFA